MRFRNRSFKLHAFCLFFLLALTSTIEALGQDEWNVPVQTIGDSLDLVEGEPVQVTGIVINSETGQPIQGASVSFDSFQHYDYTDKLGAYFIECLPGVYRVKVRQLGMLPIYMRVRVLSDATLDIKMVEGVVELKEVVITSRPLDSNVKESLAGLTTLNVQEIKTLPTLMGEVDIVKSLQLMPGVTSVGEGSSGLNVRGGRTDQNLVMLNEVPLFNTAHALGFVSAFNQDVLKDFSLYKGNVPANHGGRASSVLDIQTRRGNFDKWDFQGGAGLISSRLSVDGPIDSGRTSLLVSGRISHANWVVKKMKNPDVSRSRVSFNDMYAGIAHKFSDASSVDVIYYGSTDDFQFSRNFGYDWSTHLVSAKWQSLADKKMSPTLNASYGRFRYSFFDPYGFDAMRITNTLNYFQLKETLNYIPNEEHNFVGGLSIVGYLPQAEQRTPYGNNDAVTSKRVPRDRGIELALFANDDYQISDNISVSLGVRYSQFHHIGGDSVFHYLPGTSKNTSTIRDTTVYDKGKIISSFGGLEPRISMRINIATNQSIKISYNRMRQYIHQISNTTAPTPIDLWQVANEYLPPQVADNFSVGYFLNIKDNRWETSAEVFAKNMQNLVEYKDFPQLFMNNHIETELLRGKGRAFGGELYIRRMKGRWTGWASYTYSNTEVQVSSPIENESVNRGEWYASNYNKPHHLNLVINRSLARRGAMSFIFTYNTGRPFTAIESSYIVDDIVVPVYSDRNKYKIPDYFRLDWSFTIGNVFKKLDDSLVFAIYNFFGRDNAYSVFYQRPQSNYFIPKPYKLAVLGAAFPSLTYNFKF